MRVSNAAGMDAQFFGHYRRTLGCRPAVGLADGTARTRTRLGERGLLPTG